MQEEEAEKTFVESVDRAEKVENAVRYDEVSCLSGCHI